ncbi:helix-turn-helix transcriptional regulator [Nonomuraea sp. LP-02]|uniref:helix-turn-helix domain-containing protein n=1 Tax=Nonomuraea sp. LP-02 TaxID=3097960 RepID=UPI002E3232C7|nr:helix-turn-helix transcriptional regulator [Nonomuraea sp. LP-02]MED7929314.1 helix-turn-helix transcriptional regulator [Nonomuraea sp. LP-02]
MTTLVFSPPKLQAAFERSGLSKKAFAERCCFHSTWPVYEYLSGKRTPKRAMIERLARVLHVEPEDLCVEVEL